MTTNETLTNAKLRAALELIAGTSNMLTGKTYTAEEARDLARRTLEEVGQGVGDATGPDGLTAEEANWLQAYGAHVDHMRVEAADRGWNAQESRATSERWYELRRTYHERHGEPPLPMDCTHLGSRERASQLYAKRRAA
jgi:hypothetical protein